MKKRNLAPLGKRKSLLVLVIVLAVLLIPSVVFADSYLTDGGISVLDAGDTIDGVGLFTGNTVRVDGDVNGTAFAFGQDVTINGNIDGDLIVAGRTIHINGTVSGNIYGGGQSLNLNSPSVRDVFFGGQSILVGSNAAINRDLLVGGADIAIDGGVARDVKGGGQEITIRGFIGGDTLLGSPNITVEDGAVLDGDLNYIGENEAYISSGAVVLGQTDWQYRAPESFKEYHPSPFAKALFKVVAILGALLVWFLITLWRPQAWNNAVGKIVDAPWKTLGVGVVAFIVTPILSLLLMFTVVGIPTAMLLMVSFGVGLYLAKIVVAVCLGKWLAKVFKWKEIHKGVWLFLLGMVILTLLLMIPYFKVLVWFGIVFFGFGAIILASIRTKTTPLPGAEAEIGVHTD